MTAYQPETHGAPTFASARLPCSECGGSMWLTKIIPDRPGWEMRTFECGLCGNTAERGRQGPPRMASSHTICYVVTRSTGNG